ncbi:MAG: ATP-binding protein [Chloroflexota bacterium]
MSARRIEWAVALVPLGLTALTVLLLVSPQVAPAIVSERLPCAQAELLRIVQEALANSRKPADATRGRVDAEPIPSGVRLTIGDNDRGFVPDPKRTSGYGLRSMRERAVLIGASLTIESQPRDGTRVVVEVPFLEATG